MRRTSDQLRNDALAIWHAGVAAVDSIRLMREHLRVEGDDLWIGEEVLSMREWKRIIVVGTGKAGAGMADGLEQVLGDRFLAEKQVTGWVNVPEDCVRPLQRIHLHAARPAGVNEPTAAGVAGGERILELVGSATASDLCLCLISGGGSALLPAPVAGITLADKLAITKHLSAAGANIQELNTVRKQLSRIKGGGLARACHAGKLFSLIISDVLGDPLDVIASGPTVPDSGSPTAALQILDKFGARQAGIAPSVFQYLEKAAARTPPQNVEFNRVSNLIIGNNAAAVDAAGIEAERRGYSHAMISSRELEGTAEEVGRHHADLAWRMRHAPGPDCLITGGEPTVQLVKAEQRGRGGRNQQLALAALERLIDLARNSASDLDPSPLEGMVILSGGTDGEDGPTDAAGAIVDPAVYQAMQARRLTPRDFLCRNDAYRFFEPLGGLIKTGPTHTNVCDLRVVVTENSGSSQHSSAAKS